MKNVLQPWWKDGMLPMVNGVVDSAGNVTPIDFRNKEVKRRTSLTLAAHLKVEPHAWEIDETARAMFDDVEVIVGDGPMGGDGFVVLHPKVTFFVGENGSGKSTLLEGIARAAGLSAQGGTRNMLAAEDRGETNLVDYLTLIRGVRRPRDSFFLRAETFYNIASLIDDLGVIDSYGGHSLHRQSHGESFLALFEHRFGNDGLFFLDEPEAALSPARQLTFLAHLHGLVSRGGQFVIATHSPMLLAYPGASIYEFTADGIQSAHYDDLEHVQVTRDFLNQPAMFLRHLLM